MLRLAFSIAVLAAVAIEGSTETCRFAHQNGPAYLAMEQATLACDLETAQMHEASLMARDLSDCERKAVLQLDTMLRWAMGDHAKAADALSAYLEIAGPDEPNAAAARMSLSLILGELGREGEAERQAILAGVSYPVTGIALPPQGCPARETRFGFRPPPE